MPRLLTPAEISRQLDDLPGWALVDTALHGEFRAPDFPTAVRLVDAVAEVAEEMNHHPDVDLRWRTVRFVLSTHSAGGVTQFDIELAHRVAAEASRCGAAQTPGRVQWVELAVDCVDADAVAPVWQAALGFTLRRDPDGEPYLSDPTGRGPGVWFQRMDPPRSGRGRLHVDVYVQPARVRERVDAVLAAGGRLVSQEHAPSCWVLADPEGNELCVRQEERDA